MASDQVESRPSATLGRAWPAPPPAASNKDVALQPGEAGGISAGRQSELTKEIDLLHSQLNALRTYMKQLDARLSPVMRPTTEGTERGALDKDPPQTAAGAVIREITIGLVRVNDHMDAILTRLEI